MRRTVVAAGAILLCPVTALSGCARGSVGSTIKPVGVVTVDSHRGCKPGSRIGAWHGLPEIEGTGRNATLWALADRVPFRADRDVRLTLRMTGGGDLRVRTRGPGTPDLAPLSGPSPGGASYDRPGDEWTLVYRFPSAGCWHLKLHRDASVAGLWLTVRP
ncbi:hypothetical protein DZF91_04735 [Actinomadura logoneensis]|uniref:Uncharacterized protein n=1 Tax=Actinomadura logoneensis TaxID=2293572 RepID=A0A372JRU3_9ACTN|nr:hypothetical protein [Actinomadura logoneensis]RFU42727.1 hypothetical protein DZF91_04735 [Actinomadura logoneensis]